MSLNLEYYYGNEAEQYSFYRIPKVLFTDSRFKNVPVEAKVLYGLLLDRMALSIRNNWLDEEGRVYIIFTIADIMETLGCAEQKVNRLLAELDSAKGIGLIERKRRGLGKPNIIYVKNFIGGELPESQIKNCENHKSGNVKFTKQDLRKSQTNNTDINNTEWNDIYPSINQEQEEPESQREVGTGRKPDSGCVTDGRNRKDGMDRIDGTDKAGGAARADQTDRMEGCRQQIKKNISYDILVHDNPYDRERLDGFVELMAEACCSTRKAIRINQEDMPVETVQSRFLSLDSEHIRYVMDCLDRNTTAVGNIRAYILSALYNAPVTISQYYSSLVRHDMAGIGRGG